MNRREFISAAGAGALAPAVAGCTAFLGVTECEPGEDRLGGIEYERPVENGGASYRFRGTVVGHVDEGVLVDDSSGKAQLVPGEAMQRINRDLAAVGQCIEGRGELNPKRTRENGMVVLTVDRANFNAMGDSEAAFEPVEDYPDPEFESGHPGKGDVSITVTDGAGVTAGNVFVAYGTESHPWSDLDDATGPDDTLEAGAQVVVRDPPGEWVIVQWRSSDRTWGHRVGEAKI